MSLTYDMPMSDYLAHPGINSSRLKLMLKTSLDFKESYNESNQDTKSTILGTAIHTLMLEPDEFDRRYALQPECWGNKAKGDGKKKWDEFKKQHQGKVILDYKKEASFLLKLREKVQKNFHLRFVLAGGKPEVTGVVQEADTGLTLKARADLLTRNAIWDIKSTCDGMDDVSIYRTIKKYQYHFSAAHYMRVFNQILPESPIKNFGWIFVDTDSPALHIRMILCPQILLNKGISQHETAINNLSQCQRIDLWAGYPSEITELDLPDWAEERR